MGYSTEALVHISLNRETFDTAYKVDDYIEEQADCIKMAKETLTQLAWMTEPSKFCEEEESPECYIKNNLRWALEELEEAIINKFKAELVADAWKYAKHENGGFINVKGDFDKHQRIWCDFAVMVNEDGSNAYPDHKDHTERYNEMIKRYESRKRAEQGRNSGDSE